MVAIFTGNGTGYERGSGALLGSNGQVGSSSLGRNGEQVFVNAANGNLLISRQDEFLVGRGPDVAISRAYNSLASYLDDNGDHWQQSTDRRVFGLTGTVNTAGSTISRRSADGTESVYGWNGSCYEMGVGAGAEDTLSWNGSTWTWRDGESLNTEIYSADPYRAGEARIVSLSDVSGNQLTFTYSGDKLTTVTTADGGQTQYSWSGNNIISVVTSSGGTTLTRTRYSYDAYNRLSNVQVDLSPNDNSVADGNAYSTTYTYHGTSKLVASISQTDGSRIDIAYDGIHRVTSFSQTVASGVTRTTSLAYGQNYTIVTDPAGVATRLDYLPGDFAAPLDAWYLGALDREPATIGDTDATKFTVSPSGGWGGASQLFGVSAGETVSFGMTFQASGTATAQYLGLYDQDGWSSNGASSARVISGPGQIYQAVGGLWVIVGLSTTQATQVEVTRTFKSSGTAGAYLYVDLDGGHRPGMSVLAAKPTLLRSDTAVNPAQLDLGNWGSSGLNRQAIGIIDGNMAYQYTVQQGGSWSAIGTGLAAKGDTLTFSLTLQAVGQYTSQHLGLYGDQSQWGAAANATARIISGPGSIGQWVGGLFEVSGLSTTQPTRVQITRTYDRTEGGAAFIYDDLGGGYRQGASLIAYSPNLARRLTAPASANQLSKITTAAPQQGAPQQVVQFSYDEDGNLASVTDAKGQVSSYTYDAAGNQLTQTDPLGNLVTRTYDPATNRLLTETRTGSDAGSASAAHTIRYAYDAQGRLRFTVSAEGDVVKYRWDTYGQLQYTAEFSGQRYDLTGLAANQSISAAALVTWTENQADVSAVKHVYHLYDGRGEESERHEFGSSYWQGNPNTGGPQRQTNLTYDQAGQLLSRTVQGLNTETFVYDGLGRMTSSVDINGGTTSIFFNDAATQTTITLSSGLVETSIYNKAGELLSSTEVGTLVNGGTSTYKYDVQGRLREVKDAAGITRYFVYDKLGRKLADVDAAGGVVEYRYDAADRLVATIHYSGTTSALAALADPNNALEMAAVRPGVSTSDLWTWQVYDAAGRLVEAIDGDGSVTAYGYDQSGQLVSTRGYYNKLSTGQIDGFKLAAPSTLVLPAGHASDSIARTFYDKDGRLLATLNGEGYLSQSVYDAAGQKVRQIAYANATNAGLRASGTLDQLLSGLASPADAQARFVYDAQGLLRFEIDGLNRVVEYGYGAGTAANGAVRTTTRYAGAIAVLGSYTVASVQNAISAAGLAGHPGNHIGWAVYDGANQVVYSVDAEGFVTGYKYDISGQVIRSVQYATARSTAVLPSKTDLDAWASANANAADRVTRNYYNAGQELRFTIDAEGYATRFDYDQAGRPTASLRWDTPLAPNDGWTVSTVAGAVTGTSVASTSSYDPAGRLSSTTDAESNVRTFIWSANGKLAREISAAGTADESQTAYAYDAAGRVSAETRGYGTAQPSTTSYGYDGFGNLTSVTDPNNHTTIRAYDHAGQLVSETDAEGGVTAWQYDAFGHVVKTTDALGNSSYAYFDTLGRLVTSVDAEKYVTQTAYTVFGEVASVTRRQTPAANSPTVTNPPAITAAANDATTSFAYDRLGRLVRTTDAMGYFEHYSLNAFGDRVVVRNKLGGATVNSFDRRGLLVSERLPIASTDADGNVLAAPVDVTRFDPVYYVASNPDLAGAANDHALLLWHWNNHGWREGRNPNAGFNTQYYLTNNPDVAAANINPLDHYAAWGKNEGRQPSATTPPGTVAIGGGVINRYEYDARGNRTKMIEASGLVEQRTTVFVYDKVDRLVETRHDAVAWIGHAGYDAQNVAALSGNNGMPTERILYDARGNVIETVDANGARTLYYYDKQNRKTEQVDALGNMVSWRYDLAGNLVHERRWGASATWALTGDHSLPPITDQDRVTDYSYDANDRLKTVTQRGVRTGRWNGFGYEGWSADLVTTYTYDAGGNVRQVTDPHGGAVRSFYDRLGRKWAQVDQENYVTGWLYDAEGNVTQERRYALASPNPSLGADPRPATHAADRITDFAYDRNGRRTSETRRNVEAYAINGWGWMGQTAADSTVTYDYNGLGEVTRKIEATGAGQQYWDQHATEYGYDADGRLVRESRAWLENMDGAWVRPVVDYSYDGLGNLTRTRQTGTSGTGVGPQAERVTRYQYKAGGRLDHMWDANGAQHNYHHDLAGNVVVETWNRQNADGGEGHEGVLFTRDALGRVTSQARGSWNGVWTRGDAHMTAYNVFGEVSASGVNGLQEQYGYDRGGRLDRSNAGDGVWRYYLYDGTGNRTLTIENEGDADLVNSNADHAFWRATNQYQTGIGDTYIDGLNVTIGIFDRRGQQVEAQLRQRELAVGNLQNLTTGRGYNAFGEVVTERDTRGKVTNLEYNTMGRLTRRINPFVSAINASPIQNFYYDISGRMVGSRDANGNLTTQALLNGTGYGGSAALVIREAHADGGVAHQGYDVFGDLRRSTDEIGRARNMTYDNMGRLTWEGHANGYHEAYTYDLLGQRIRHWDNFHTDVELTDYDLEGRVTRQTAFGGDTVWNAYSWIGSLYTSGMGTYGGWHQLTTQFNGLQSISQSDVFGRALWKQDLGGHSWGMSYDVAGRMTGRSGQDSASYTWLNTGLVGAASGNGYQAGYGYDAAGNRIAETLSRNGVALQSATAQYDELGRMTRWEEAGNATTPAASIDYEYDAQGNIRHSVASFWAMAQDGSAHYQTSQDYRYRYDAMNRVVTAKGIQQGGQIVRGWQGADYEYDAAGQRVASRVNAHLSGEAWTWVWYPGHGPGTQSELEYPQEGTNGDYQFVTKSYDGERRETYAYDAGGTLLNVYVAETGYTDNGDGTISSTGTLATPVLVGAFTNDLLGRTTHQTDYRAGQVVYDRQVTFNAAGQVGSETVVTRQGNDTWTSSITNQYGTGTGYALGAVLSTTTSDSKNGAFQYSSTTTNAIAWWDGAVTASSSYARTGQVTALTSFTYGAAGALESVAVGGARPRSVTFTNDMNGQVIRRDEQDNLAGGDPHEAWYRFGGKQVGRTGNNGMNGSDYTRSIATRTAAPGTGAFRSGATYGWAEADFDQSLAPINSYSQGGGGGSYQVRGGDTLAGIAANLWGDSSLWYKLAAANGLGANAALVEGQRLSVPSGVMKNTHNASTFNPYDPSETIGDLGPAPKPTAQKNKCGAFGAIMLAAVAVAVTIATAGAAVAALTPISTIGSGISAFLGIGGATTTLGAGALVGVGAVAGAAGSIASQGLGVATGIQDRFSWKSVAISALSSAISGGIGKVGLLRGASGVGRIAQSVARGAISSAAVQGISVATGLQDKFDWAGIAAAGVSSAAIGALRVPGFGGSLLKGAVGAVAGGAARSLVDGTSFGDNVLAALPDVIGQTIGEAIAGKLASTGRIVGLDGADRRIQLAQNIDPSVQSDSPSGYGEQTYQGPVWRGEDGHYVLHVDGSMSTYYTQPSSSIFSQNSMSLLISYAGAAVDRHRAQVAYAYRQINAYEAQHPGSFARWAGARAERQAHVNAALGRVDAGFLAMIAGPMLVGGGAASLPIAVSTFAAAPIATAVNTTLAIDAATGGIRSIITGGGNFRSVIAEGVNRVTGTGANGLGVGDVLVIGANLLNIGRAAVQGIGSRFSRAAAPAESLTISAKVTGNPAAIARGFGELNARQSGVLGRLERYGSRTITGKNFGQNDLAALTAATGDEFALFTAGGRRLIVRGGPADVPIDTGMAAALGKQGWRFSSHSHPGTSAAVLQSSIGDRAVLTAMGGARSAILNSLGQRGLYNTRADDLSRWLSW